jgi:hypothetical protein
VLRTPEASGGEEAPKEPQDWLRSMGWQGLPKVGSYTIAGDDPTVPADHATRPIDLPDISDALAQFRDPLPGPPPPALAIKAAVGFLGRGLNRFDKGVNSLIYSADQTLRGRAGFWEPPAGFGEPPEGVAMMAVPDRKMVAAAFARQLSRGGGRIPPGNLPPFGRNGQRIGQRPGLSTKDAKAAIERGYREAVERGDVKPAAAPSIPHGQPKQGMLFRELEEPAPATPQKAPGAAQTPSTPQRVPNPNAKRPIIETRLPDRVTKELPAGEGRTPAEKAQARNFYKRNSGEARKWYTEREGLEWPLHADPKKAAKGELQWAEHPRSLKDGGDPLYIEPGIGPDPNAPHVQNGDSVRFGKMGGRPKKKPPQP